MTLIGRYAPAARCGGGSVGAGRATLTVGASTRCSSLIGLQAPAARSGGGRAVLAGGPALWIDRLCRGKWRFSNGFNKRFSLALRSERDLYLKTSQGQVSLCTYICSHITPLSNRTVNFYLCRQLNHLVVHLHVRFLLRSSIAISHSLAQPNILFIASYLVGLNRRKLRFELN